MTIRTDVRDHVLVITLDSPERLNALDNEHFTDLSNAWRRFADDDELRVAVVTGQGERAFCVGADLKSSFVDGVSYAQLWHTQHEMLINRGLEIWKPVITAVNGLCLGAGMTMMLATDIRLAVPDATFGFPEVARGLFPANGGTQRLAKQVPLPIAMEWLLTGDRIDAETAVRWGLVNRIVPREDLLNQALGLADRIAGQGSLAVQAAKELAIRSFDLDLRDGLRLEQVMFRLLQETPEAKQRIDAFRERSGS